jgi:hypothetical protein
LYYISGVGHAAPTGKLIRFVRRRTRILWSLFGPWNVTRLVALVGAGFCSKEFSVFVVLLFSDLCWPAIVLGSSFVSVLFVSYLAFSCEFCCELCS